MELKFVPDCDYDTPVAVIDNTDDNAVLKHRAALALWAAGFRLLGYDHESSLVVINEAFGKPAMKV